MNQTNETLEWAQREFGQTPGFEQRSQERLVHSTAVLTQRPHGWQSIWRGLQRLADLVLGLELADGIRSGQFGPDEQTDSG